MTTYNNLPVYKKSYDLLLELFQVASNFQRDYRFSIGEDIKKEMISIIILIYRANKDFKDRKMNINQIRKYEE